MGLASFGQARLELSSDGALHCRCLVELQAPCALAAGVYTCDLGLAASPPVNLTTAAPSERLYEVSQASASRLPSRAPRCQRL